MSSVHGLSALIIRDLDYSGYHKNRIKLLFYHTLNEKCSCFFTDGKQHEARELDMITRDIDMIIV